MGRKKLRIEFDDLKYNRHSYYNLVYHLVLVTKYRKKCIDISISRDLMEVFYKVLEINRGELISYTWGDDYVHLSFELSPLVELTKLVNSLKSSSSKVIRGKYKEILKNFYDENVFWSLNYCLLTPSDNLGSIIKKYLDSEIGVKE